MWVNYTVIDSRFFFLAFFLLPVWSISPADRKSQQNLMYDGSKDVVWRKDVFFECPKCFN